MKCRIRRWRPEDFGSISGIYRASILGIGGEHYSPLQVETWASFASDAEEFRAWLSGALTLVAVGDADECLGFGGLQPHGRISSLFVAPEYMRRGIASALLRRLIGEAGRRGHDFLTAEASEFARPVFERFGFSVIEVEHTQFKGVDFSRYAMQARI